MIMARKKRIMITSIIATIVALLIIAAVGIILYIKTDMFKSNETLFLKYLSQNLNIADSIKTTYATNIEDTLENNKYTSNLNGKMEYTQNISTSNENKNSPVNNIKFNMSSDVEGNNNTYHRNIKITQDTEELIGVETLKTNENYGVRLNGIKQYLVEENDTNKVLNLIGLIDYEDLIKMSNNSMESLNLEEILDFSEEEKATLTNEYVNIIKANISKEDYKKQTNAMVTVNSQSLNTTAYYIEISREKYNDISIAILNQLINDEIILGKVDVAEEKIKDAYPSYNSDKTLRKKVIEYLNTKIDIIKNNVGSDTIKITVYQNKMNTVETVIETTEKKLTIDTYDGTGFKIDFVKLGASEDEQTIEFQRIGTEDTEQIIIQAETIKANTIMNDIKINIDKNMNNNEITKKSTAEISNEKYKTTLEINNEINVVDSFKDDSNSKTINDMEKNLANNSEILYIKDYTNEQLSSIANLLQNNLNTQLENIKARISLQDYLKMLVNLNVIEEDKGLNLNEIGEVSEVEKTRFNSSFEFYKSEHLTADNIKGLISVMSKNITGVKLVNTDNSLYNLTSEIVNDDKKLSETIKNLKGVVITIQKKENDNLYSDLLTKLFEKLDEKYTVSLSYNSTSGLVDKVGIAIEE